ncbi:DUF6932 family protein [Burkholderia multivorans]|uniref:DUF6932 family protein n=2 Tax=Burkholderia multivorans TaxID=87883 RepID=UPI003BA9091A
MVLPPYVGPTPTDPGSMSPFPASFSEYALAFGYSEPRISILRGLHTYRSELRAQGFAGFQWFDGSFSEQVELSRGRPPGDIDVVTFCYRPSHLLDNGAFRAWAVANQSLLHPKELKSRLKCEAFFIDMHKPPHILVNDVRYWTGLFSHQRNTSLWKGMVQVPLQSDDDDAVALLG